MNKPIDRQFRLDSHRPRKQKPTRHRKDDTAVPPDLALLRAAYQDHYRSLSGLINTGVEGISAGTRIETSKGPVAIESLKIGDLVRTADNGFLPLLWKGATKRKGTDRDAPVLVRAGALGNDREIIVSPRQRIMLSGPNVERLFSRNEVLVAARFLVNDNSIRRLEMEEVVYYHFLLSEHSIIFTDGCPTESLHLGTLEWSAISEAARQALVSLSRGTASLEQAPLSTTARNVLSVYEACLVRSLMQ